jgi:hypothetical protein
MFCAITGSSGVLGSYIVKNNPQIKFIKFKGDITNKNQITNWILKNNQLINLQQQFFKVLKFL